MKERIIEIGRDSVWYLASNVLTVLIAFLSVPILTRVFTPHNYGVFSLVNTALILISPLFYSWMVLSIIRFYPEYKNNDTLDVFYSSVLHYLPIIGALFLIVAIPLTAFVLPLGKYRLLICAAVMVFPFFIVFNILLGLIRARQLTWQYALLNVIVTFGRYIVGAVLAGWLHSGVSGPFLGWLGALLIAVPLELFFISAWRHFDWEKHSTKLYRQFFSYGFVLIFVTFLSEILIAADRYMVLWFKGAYQVGLYSVSYSLIRGAEGMIAQFIMLAASPIVIRVYENQGVETAEELIGKVTRYFIFFTLPVMVAIYVLRVPLLTVVTTRKYLPAQSCFLPISLGIFVSNIAWFALLPFYLKKKTVLTLVPTGTAAALNLALNFVLIPSIGFNGAAWATFISYLVFLVITVLISSKYMRWRFPYVAAGKATIATALMAISLYLLARYLFHGWLGLALLVLVGTAVYIGTLFSLKAFKKSEIEFAFGLPARLFALIKSRFRREAGGGGALPPGAEPSPEEEAKTLELEETLPSREDL